MSRSVATAFIGGALFPLHERLKGHDTVARRHRLEASQWLPRDALEAARVETLRRFLGRIARHVPYYRQAFAQAGFDPAGVTSTRDLAALPFLTKPIIRAHAKDLTADDAGPLKRYNTGGSSGEPLVFYMGKDRISHDVAAKWRATRWWDCDIGDVEVVVWGSPIELGSQDRLRGLRDRLFRSTLLPAFDMSEANLDRFVAALRARRPRMLFGYPSALALIARHARARGTRMDDLGIRVAFVTAEVLYDDQKTTIAEVFGCRVANGYGARDAGFVAHECTQGGMHVNAEDIVVEIVDADGAPVPAGTPGEIVITHMDTHEFPFVRYRTGDIAALDGAPCACGRGLPLLAGIQGRATDFVVASDGRVLHGLALIYAVRDLPGVAQFRIVQHDLARTEVQLVVTPEFGDEHERGIVRDFKARLGADVSVDVRRVDAIPPERSGKFRYVVSHVAAPGAHR